MSCLIHTIIIIIVGILRVECSQSANGSLRIPVDVWMEIVPRLDIQSLGRLMRVDNALFENIKDCDTFKCRKMEHDILLIIRTAQKRGTLQMYRVFRHASPKTLMNQYLMGFTADLTTYCMPPKYTQWERDVLNELLSTFKQKYWQIVPTERLTKNKTLRVRFDYFTSMQNKSEHYLSRLRSVDNKSCQHYDVIPIISNFKMMMQLIGSQIHYPGIIESEFPHQKASQYLADIKATFLSLAYLKYEQNQFLTQWQLKLNRALESIDGCYELFDEVINFLDELNNNLIDL